MRQIRGFASWRRSALLLALAVAASFVLSIVAGFFPPPGWELRPSMTAMLAAAIRAGLIFGYFPACNAAWLDPVEALACD